MRKFSIVRSFLLSAGLALSAGMLVASAALPPPGKPEVLPPTQGALTVIVPDRGYIDDAIAISADGGTLLYVQTDGASFASLRAIGLVPRPHHANLQPPVSTVPTAANAAAPPPAPAAAPAKKGAKGAAPAIVNLPAPPIDGLPQVNPSDRLPVDKSQEIIANIPLSVARLVLLPEDRVLVVLRDTDVGDAVQGAIYSLKTRSKIALTGPGTSEGNIGPTNDITIANSAGGPLILSLNRPEESPRGEYRLHTWNASTLKAAGARTYQVRDSDGRVTTDKGTGQPLYFLDDYQTLVTKHDGYFDKKKDMRQPDFVGFVDTLTGKLRHSQPIVDPAGTLLHAKLREKHSEPMFIHIDPASHKIELFRQDDKVVEGANAESRVELNLPRPSRMYEMNSLAYQMLRRDRMVFSLTVDPVNEEAVAAKRADPDIIDFCALNPQDANPTVTKLLSLPGHKRPAAWVIAPVGRLAILRKHKNFPRGGTQVEVYDVNF